LLSFLRRLLPYPGRLISKCRLELYIICGKLFDLKYAKLTAWLIRDPVFTSISFPPLVPRPIWKRFFGEIKADAIRRASFHGFGALVANATHWKP
jgi:hypothetical protein